MVGWLQPAAKHPCPHHFEWYGICLWPFCVSCVDCIPSHLHDYLLPYLLVHAEHEKNPLTLCKGCSAIDKTLMCYVGLDTKPKKHHMGSYEEKISLSQLERLYSFSNGEINQPLHSKFVIIACSQLFKISICQVCLLCDTHDLCFCKLYILYG